MADDLGLASCRLDPYPGRRSLWNRPGKRHDELHRNRLRQQQPCPVSFGNSCNHRRTHCTGHHVIFFGWRPSQFCILAIPAGIRRDCAVSMDHHLGSLPAGLTLVPSSGLISGTAGTTAGTANFTATVTDSSSPAQTASATESITIAPASLSITSATLAQATSGTAYLQTLQAAGGTGAYSWQITSGQLASGLSISASGVISGTPTTSTPSTFSVTVSDSGSPAQTQSATFTIAATAPVVPPLSIVSSTLAATTTGSSYSQTLQASGGTPGYTWSIASGILPAGLTLASSTGVISGTPSGSGTATFTVAVSDNGSPTKSASASTSIAVTAPVVSAGTTWYIRTDGGTRYSANVPQGQCDGKTDAAYPGTGTNQPCAFKDFRYMWDDQSYNGYTIPG